MAETGCYTEIQAGTLDQAEKTVCMQQSVLLHIGAAATSVPDIGNDVIGTKKRFPCRTSSGKGKTTMKHLFRAYATLCVLISVVSFALGLQPDEHDPSSTVTYDECARAFACDFTFEGVDRLGNFSMDVHRKTVFTPPIRAYNPNHHVSYVATSERTESYECTGEGSNRSCGFKFFHYQSYDWGPMWLFAPELYDGMAVSGIAPEVVRGIDREQARNRCIRVRFNTIYMLNDDWRPTGVDIIHAVDDDIWDKDNKCVMFLVH